MTEEIAADATISMGLQPSGYTVWVNGPMKCRIRICGLTEGQAQQLREGLLDITLPMEVKNDIKKKPGKKDATDERTSATKDEALSEL